MSMIVECQIKMFSFFSKEAKNFIRKLLNKDPAKRLGAGTKGINQIKCHPFFENIDWDALQNKQIKPSFVPKVTGELDLSNIDGIFTKEDRRETPTDESALKYALKFEHFTYDQNKDEDSLLKESDF